MDESSHLADAAGGVRPDPEALRHLQRGIAAAQAGALDGAIDSFRQAVARQPQLAAAQANLGLSLISVGRRAEALAPLEAALRIAKADGVLLNALAMALEAHGRFDEAAARWRAALALRPDDANLHANLGHRLRRDGRLDEARACYDAAIALQPGLTTAHVGIGDVHQALARHDDAIASYRRALALDPQAIGALHNLGCSLRKTGALAAAREAYERVLELSPEQIETHNNLSLLKTYAAGDAQIERLLAMRERLPGLPIKSRERWCFTVGKMLEDTGRHDEAFAALAQGNGLKRDRLRWDEAADVAQHHAMREVFTRALFERHATPDCAAHEGPVPVFIVGMPRSGTSLLEQVLATLPGVHGAGELTELPDALQAAAHETAPGAAAFAQWSTEDFRRLGRDYRARIARLAPAGSTHVIDKLPDNFMRLGLIHLALPEARIVHAMRDPMDTCFSCYARLFEQDHLGFSYDLATLGRYWRRYDAMMRHWHAVLPPGRRLDMPYEALVADIETQARRLVEHLGLPWDARCLAFHDNPRVVNTASVAQVRRPLYGSSVARWKAFERHLGPLQAIIGA